MIKEIEAASQWWSQHLSKTVSDPSLVSAFTRSLSELMAAHCQGHWYEDDCERGSAYRSVSYDMRLDPLLARAAADVGLAHPMKLLASAANCVMYVNPGSVRVRCLHNHYAPALCVYPPNADGVSSAAATGLSSVRSPSSSIASPGSDSPASPASPASHAASPSSSPLPLMASSSSSSSSHHRSASADVMLPASLVSIVAAAASSVSEIGSPASSSSASASPVGAQMMSSPAPAPMYHMPHAQHHIAFAQPHQQHQLPPRASPPNSGRRQHRGSHNQGRKQGQQQHQQQQQQGRQSPPAMSFSAVRPPVPVS